MKIITQNYATSFDGTAIHYCASGEGSPAIVCCNCLGLTPCMFRHLVNYFSGKQRVVCWDYRGHGMSYFPRDADNIDTAALVSDLLAVLDEADLERAILLAHGSGVMIALEFMRSHPKRVSALIAICGSHEGHFLRRLPVPRPEVLMKVACSVGERFPGLMDFGLGRLSTTSLASFLMGEAFLDRSLVCDEDLCAFVQDIRMLDSELYFTLVKQMADQSAADVLDGIRVPTLAICGGRDRLTPSDLMKQMVSRVPAAELFHVKNGTFALPVEQPETLNLRIDKFIRERVS